MTEENDLSAKYNHPEVEAGRCNQRGWEQDLFKPSGDKKSKHLIPIVSRPKY